MHPNYMFCEGRNHLKWLLGPKLNQLDSKLQLLLGPYGKTIYRTLVIKKSEYGL